MSARVPPGTGFKDHLGRGLEVVPTCNGSADLSLKASISCVVLGSQADPGPTLHCCVTLSKSLNLSELQFKIGLEIPVSKWVSISKLLFPDEISQEKHLARCGLPGRPPRPHDPPALPEPCGQPCRAQHPSLSSGPRHPDRTLTPPWCREN